MSYKTNVTVNEFSKLFKYSIADLFLWLVPFRRQYNLYVLSPYICLQNLRKHVFYNSGLELQNILSSKKEPNSKVLYIIHTIISSGFYALLNSKIVLYQEIRFWGVSLQRRILYRLNLIISYFLIYFS